MRPDERDLAFSEYVAARQPALRRVAYGLSGSWDRADDLLQNALAKLYVAWPRVQGVTNEDAYVRRILLNSHIDETRRPWRRESPGLSAYDVQGPPDDAVEERDALVAALRRLPAMQRKVVVLRFVADLSVEATARELGISTGTVKSHTARALSRLQDLLTPALPTGDRS